MTGSRTESLREEHPPCFFLHYVINSEIIMPAKSKRGREEEDGTENVMNCRDVCLALRFVRCPSQALRRPTRHSCAHAAHWDSPGEFGRLLRVSPKSAGPIRGAHSACACHAALSNVQEMGPHSSELVCLKLS